MTEGAGPYSPSEEERKLHEQFIAEVNKRELAGSDNFDKSILTLSSGGLGLSLSFLRDMGGQAVTLPWLLYCSWLMFVVATVSTMASFLVSAKALDHQKDVARRAYLEGNSEAFSEANIWDQCTRGLNLASAVAFFCALGMTIGFVITNVEGRRMAGNSTNNNGAAGDVIQRGATVPTMQRPSSPPTTQSGSGGQSSGQSPTGSAGNSGKQG